MVPGFQMSGVGYKLGFTCLLGEWVYRLYAHAHSAPQAIGEEFLLF